MDLIRRTGNVSYIRNESVKPADTMPANTKRWAVSRIDWFDNELTTKIVAAENEKAAFKIAFPDFNFFDTTDSLKQAKRNAFDQDNMMINVVEIPEV